MPSLLRYFRPKCAERCRHLVRSSGLPQAIFKITGFQILHQWAFSNDQNICHIEIITIHIIRSVRFDLILVTNFLLQRSSNPRNYGRYCHYQGELIVSSVI